LEASAKTNVIESSFATIRHRTVRSKGCLSSKTALAMIFKLAEAAERSWRRLDGHRARSLAKLIDLLKVVSPTQVGAARLQFSHPENHSWSAIETATSGWLPASKGSRN
jgi:hypothetical protein